MSLHHQSELRTLLELAKREDFRDGDLTADLMADPRESAIFRLVVKEPCVWAGVEIAPDILQMYDPTLSITWIEPDQIGGPKASGKHAPDGCFIGSAPTTPATIRGPLGPILSAERVLLNFLQRLCGIATLTRAYVDAVKGTRAAIFDTRKTTPGWRVLDKYAVRCGGGTNHRMGLFDAVLIKDNHLAGVPRDRLAGVVFDMLNRLVDDKSKPAFVEVEADHLDQIEELLKVVGIDVILLDNFTIEDLKRAVELRDAQGLKDRVALEASGGITLENVRAVAQTGVERISVGAVTHSARSVDLSLERV